MNYLSRQFYNYSPDWLFARMYNLFLAENRQTKITRCGNEWLIMGQGKGDISLLSPTAKFLNVRKPFYDKKYASFFQIKKGDSVLDVGGCIGDTAVFMRRQIGDEGLLVVVEPHPINFRYLDMNTAQYENVTIVQKAVSDKRETIKLYLHRALSGHTALPDLGDNNFVWVEADTIDSLVGNVTFDFAKIDVQGLEIKALAGADGLLKTCPKVIVGIHDAWNPDKVRTKVEEILKDYGYKIVFGNSNVYAWRGH